MQHINKTLMKILLWIIALSIMTIIYRGVALATYEESQRISSWLPINLLLPIDNAIPFLPITAPIYISMHLFWLIPACARHINIAQFVRLSLAMVILHVIAAIIHCAIPVAYHRPTINAHESWALSLTQIIYDYDLPNNTFPSGHVGIVTIFIAALYQNIKWQWFILCTAWGMLVVISTLTLKQHFVIDVPAGILLGLLVYHYTPTIRFLKSLC